ncbi:MAG: hypothetical protein KAX81_04985 [Leadbetterella sp.]|nr:hypothetical protein [Leadbetterella sp.]
MKKYHIIIFLSLAISFCMAQSKEPFAVKKFTGVNIQTVKVNTSGGGIKVFGSEGKDAEVRVFINTNNWNKTASKSEIEEELKNYILEMEYKDGSIVCLAKPKDPEMKRQKLSIGFEVYSPSKVNVNLATAGGGITLDNLEGDLNFKTSGGGITVSKLKGKVDGKTSGGGIKMQECDGMITMKTSGGGISAKSSKGNINLSTSGGGIELSQLKGTIKAHTSGGGIDSEEIKGSLDVSTSGGRIELNQISGDVIARTSGGGIDANIVKLGKVLSLSTSAGNIHANIPFSEGMDLDIKGNRIKSDKLSKVSSNLDSGRVKGKVNGGGTEVTMSASSGTIYVE